MVRSDNPDFGPPVEALGVAIAGQSGIATVDRAALALEFARVFREDFDQIVPLECGGRSLAALASDLTTQLGLRLDAGRPFALLLLVQRSHHAVRPAPGRRPVAESDVHTDHLLHLPPRPARERPGIWLAVSGGLRPGWRGCGAEAAVDLLGGGGAGGDCVACHMAAVAFQNVILGVIDRAGVLADVAGGVDAAGKLAELSALNGFQSAHTDFGGLRDCLQGDAAIAPNRG